MVVGCFGADGLPESKPDLEDLVGSWHATDSTREYIRRLGYESSSHAIDIRRDGTIEFLNIPDCWRLDYPPGQGSLENGEGTWELELYYSRWVISLYFDNQINCIWCLSLHGAQPPYTMKFNVGDPDTPKVLVFKRDDRPAP